MAKTGLRIDTEKASGDRYKVRVSFVEDGSITPSTHSGRFVKEGGDAIFCDEFVTPDGRIKVVRFGIGASKAGSDGMAASGGAGGGGGGGAAVSAEKSVDDVVAAGGAGGGAAAAAASPLLTSPASGSYGDGGRSEADSKKTGSGSTSRISRKDVDKVSQAVIHEEVEKEVFKEAVGYLCSHKDCRTVLVDILERDFVDDVSRAPKSSTHTVVLYKNPGEASSTATRITVIDPSNFDFSLHLSNRDMKDVLAGLSWDLPSEDMGTVSAGKKVEIITIPSKKKIYHAKGDKGAGLEQFRDCVDIAVKIAFYLNYPEIFEDQPVKAIIEIAAGGAGGGGGGGAAAAAAAAAVVEKPVDALAARAKTLAGGGGGGAAAAACSDRVVGKNYPSILSESDLLKCHTILALQRDGDMAKLWYDSVKVPMRLRQSSDPRVSAAFYKVTKLMQSYFKIDGTLSLGIAQKYNADALALLNTYDYKKCLTDLCVINTSLIKDINAVLYSQKYYVDELMFDLIGNSLSAEGAIE